MDDTELRGLIELCLPLFEAMLRGEHGAVLQREARAAVGEGDPYAALAGILYRLAPRIEAAREAHSDAVEGPLRALLAREGSWPGPDSGAS